MSNTVSTPADVIFEALEKWIKQRPGLDFRNYGDIQPYRAELRSIAADKRRAMAALDEARGLSPAMPDVLMDSFRAFSGRLQWIPARYVSGMGDGSLTTDPATGEKYNQAGHLEYVTGQYWPTEYRKAAASVLETYISEWRRAQNAQNPQTFTYRTMEDVKAANAQIGGHFFDRGTMRFFNSKIESGLIGGRYFITSERMDENHPRRYSVREAKPDGSIGSGEFGKYGSRDEAREAIREAMKGGK